jgi:hypothetical protein
MVLMYIHTVVPIALTHTQYHTVLFQLLIIIDCTNRNNVPHITRKYVLLFVCALALLSTREAEAKVGVVESVKNFFGFGTTTTTTTEDPNKSTMNPEDIPWGM